MNAPTASNTGKGNSKGLYYIISEQFLFLIFLLNPFFQAGVHIFFTPSNIFFLGLPQHQAILLMTLLYQFRASSFLNIPLNPLFEVKLNTLSIPNIIFNYMQTSTAGNTF